MTAMDDAVTAIKAAGMPHWVSPCGSVLLVNGDCLDVLPLLPEGGVDAVVTDPPYSSGGAFRGDRAQRTVSKYVQTGTLAERVEFSGDSRDQRAFFAWCSLWLCAAQQASSAGAVICCFIDWRQLPLMTDAIQSGNWVWRNIGCWWKPGIRMQRGRFSSSAEFVVYGTNGPHESDGEGSPQNVFSCAPVSGEDKSHIAEKPVAVVKWALSVSRPRSVVLDPFAGSASGAVACIETGRSYIGIEKDSACYEGAVARIAEGLGMEVRGPDGMTQRKLWTPERSP